MSKLDGIKAGDRVRAVIEGVVKDVNDCLVLHTSEGSILTSIMGEEIGQYVVSVTRIEPAFKLGDEVLYLSSSDKAVIVAFLKDGRAVIEYEAGDTTNVRAYDISCLQRA